MAFFEACKETLTYVEKQYAEHAEPKVKETVAYLEEHAQPKVQETWAYLEEQMSGQRAILTGASVISR